jgi:hypothetical protein
LFRQNHGAIKMAVTLRRTFWGESRVKCGQCLD